MKSISWEVFKCWHLWLKCAAHYNQGRGKCQGERELGPFLGAASSLQGRAPNDRFFTTRPIILFNRVRVCPCFLKLAPTHFSNHVKPCILFSDNLSFSNLSRWTLFFSDWKKSNYVTSFQGKKSTMATRLKTPFVCKDKLLEKYPCQ